jgi:subtilisin family serine protease
MKRPQSNGPRAAVQTPQASPKRPFHRLAISLLCVTLPALSAAQSAQQQFAGTTSTKTGYATWDLDAINSEQVTQTGQGVYVAVLDTGLVPNWRDYFPEARIATKLGAGFDQPVTFKAGNLDPCGYDVEVGQLSRSTWVGSRGSSHGSHVTSTIIGYYYKNPYDTLNGFDLPPLMVRGVAPEVTIIPVKVLADYKIPALPKCGYPGGSAVFGTSAMIAAGLDYVTDLARAGYRPMVVNMSLGGSALEPVEQAALDRAIANGVIVVAAAGNEGTAGMGYPGAYAPVISVGSAGWTGEWSNPDAPGNYYRMWWLQYGQYPVLPNAGNVADPTSVNDLYVSDFSSRALQGQQLDVLAPGSWVRGPFPGDPAYQHLPWWSNGRGVFRSPTPLANFYFVGGTSMATPHVASVAALMLQKKPTLVQAEVESILKANTLPMPDTGSRFVLEVGTPTTVNWDTSCGIATCDPVGAGFLQADKALGGTP